MKRKQIDRPTAIYVNSSSNPLKYQHHSLQLIGNAIRNAALDPSIRNHAARCAARAPRKDYVSQARAIYDDFLSRWRYVKDPVGVECIHGTPDAIYKYVIAGDGIGLGDGYGAGDCDDATIALGSLYRSIGFPVRLATMAPPGAPPGKMMTHIFPQISIPSYGWMSVDAVPYPTHGFGFTPPHSRLAWYGLAGKLEGYVGNYEGEEKMQNMEFQDLGFSGYGLPSENDPGSIWDWRKYGGISGFGAYSEEYGILEDANHLMAEVQTFRLPNGTEIARTPMIEISPIDAAYVNSHQKPYDGMLGLGDDGSVYAYSGFDGFFKRLFKRVSKAVKAVRKKVRKLMKKTKFGRYLVKIGDKVRSVAMKFVRPLVKFVGKYAAKLAPVAALIPGYGPAIAAALGVAGKVAKLMTKYGVAIAGEKGKPRVLAYRNAETAQAFKQELANEAAQTAKVIQLKKYRASQTRTPQYVQRTERGRESQYIRRNRRAA